MSTSHLSTLITLTPADSRRLASLCGPFDQHIQYIEKRLNLDIRYRDYQFHLSGSEQDVAQAERIIQQLYAQTLLPNQHIKELDQEDVHMALVEPHQKPEENLQEQSEFAIKTKRGLIKARNAHQLQYIQAIQQHDVNFGIGPAGTGKTYLAVAAAVDALDRQEIRKIILTRPAVEAGEKLGFLPGDLSQKVDPYLRPLYDALFEMLGFERVEKLIERQVIEVAPLAYMRGRTLNDAFIILDESQNTTKEQMKMFLTRIGFNSKAVITGDITQIDLPRGQYSGLKEVIQVLQGIPEISFTFFKAGDVVRHPVVQKIVMAYEDYDHKQHEQRQQEKKEASPHETTP